MLLLACCLQEPTCNTITAQAIMLTVVVKTGTENFNSLLLRRVSLKLHSLWFVLLIKLLKNSVGTFETNLPQHIITYKTWVFIGAGLFHCFRALLPLADKSQKQSFILEVGSCGFSLLIFCGKTFFWYIPLYNNTCVSFNSRYTSFRLCSPLTYKATLARWTMSHFCVV